MNRRIKGIKTKKEWKVKAGNYKSNNEILEDFMLLIEAYGDLRHETQMKGTSCAKDVKKLIRLRGDIKKKVMRAVSKKQSLPVIDMIIKHKLSFVNLSIIMYVYVSNFLGIPDSVGDVARFLSLGASKTVISKMKLFSPNAPLFRSGLMRSNNVFSRGTVDITRAAKEYLQGYPAKRHKGAGKAAKAVKFASPREIYDRISEYVMGQDEAKKKIAVGVFNHLQRVSLPERKKQNIRKSNILMLGPTGSGKTYICENLAKIMGVPFAVADATRYTSSGYVGGDIDDVLRLLIDKAGGDTKAAEKGIIYIDEIDKLACRASDGHHSNRDVGGLSVQQELLRLLEGDSSEVYSYERNLRTVKRYNTGDILFICGGAFTGVKDIINRRVKASQRMGFGSSTKKEDADSLSKVKLCDIEEFGMIPELLGRFAVITQLEPLGRDDLVRILTVSRNSIFSQYSELMNANGLKLRIDGDIAGRIADEALRRGYGARGLRQIMEDMLSPMLFDTIGNGGDGNIRLKEEDLKYG